MGKHQPTCPGTRDGTLSAKMVNSLERPFWRQWMLLPNQKDQRTNHSDFLSRMYTRSVVLELFLWDVLRQDLSRLAWLLLSLLLQLLLRSNQWKCTTLLLRKLSLETMLAST